MIFPSNVSHINLGIRLFKKYWICIFSLIFILASKIPEKFQVVIDNIDHDGWVALKKRYIFARKHVIDFLNPKENDSNIGSYIENVFQDEEKDLFNLIKKCTEKTDSEVHEIISRIEDQMIPDKELVSICNQEIILDKFFKEYKEWRTQILPSKLKQAICDFIGELHSSNNILHINDIVEGEY